MLALAIRQNGLSGTTISDYEIRSEAEVNYTIDTVRYFVRNIKIRNFSAHRRRSSQSVSRGAELWKSLNWRRCVYSSNQNK
jgi:nicotinic acid mononucleotide adenylyltransferase